MNIYDLSHVPSIIFSEIGGKARGLFLLSTNGFPIAPGFILVGASTEEDFLQAYQRYEEMGLGKVAIRSSATMEDGNIFSNAGQFETVLNVEGKENFIAAIKQCISSLDNERSRKYSDVFMDGNDNHMTVVVEQMVQAKYAGVLFTKDPMEKESVLIEVVEGLGEGLVSGDVAAQQYRVKDGKIVFMPKDPYLSEEKVLAMAKDAIKIEECFKIPMDIEWAMDEKKDIYYLQARPITTLHQEEASLSEFDYPHDVTNYTITTCNVREMLPTAVTPLTLSSSVYCLDYGMRKMMVANHAIKSIDDLPPYSCITPFYNNLFFNMTTNYINAYRIAGTCKETSDISICGRVLEDFPDHFANYAPQIVRIKNLFHFIPFVLSDKKAKNGMNQAINHLNFNYEDSMQGLYKQSEDMFPLLEDVFFYHYCSSYYSGAAQMSFVNMMRKIFTDQNKIDSLVAGVLTGIEGVESARIIEMMKELAGEIIKHNPEAKSYNKKQLAEYLSSCDGKVKEYLDEFMRVNGHRGVSEEELRAKCWSDDMDVFAESLLGVIATYDKDGGKAIRSWQDYRSEILASVKKNKRKKVDQLITRSRSGVWLREYTKSRCVLAVSRYRKAYRLIAEKMVQANLLPDADLIYFLTKEEVGKLLQGDKSLVRKAMSRRRIYPTQCSMKFEEVYCGKPVPIKEEETNEGKSQFTGVPASQGVVKGKVRIVKTMEDANKLQPGEIMVVSTVDIGWSPYYCLAGGLLTEIGSCLSHGVVVAREYGLPTIVNAHGVISGLHNGDIVTMDGSKGTVSVMKGE